MITVDFVKKCIENADSLISKLPIEVSQYPGLSSQRVRHLINNLCSFGDAKYLNIGLYSGSSYFSAIFNNSLKATGIDFWRNGLASKVDEINFFKNLGEILSKETETLDREFNIINQDCFMVKLKDKYNVYFYDADHSYEGTYKSLAYFDKYLEDRFIFLMDDFDYPMIKESTNNSIADMGYKVEYRWEGIGDFGNWDVLTNNVWWNGLLVCLLEKNK